MHVASCSPFRTSRVRQAISARRQERPVLELCGEELDDVFVRAHFLPIADGSWTLKATADGVDPLRAAAADGEVLRRILVELGYPVLG